MTQIKLIALDMDGTLLDDDLTVSPANREAIAHAQQKGVHVVLSTGRYILSAREYAESLGLTTYIVSSNGSEVWSYEGDLVERHVLPAEMVEWMRDTARYYGTRFWGTAADGVWHAEDFPEDVYGHDWLKCGFSTEDDRTRQTVWESLQATRQLELTNSSPWNIEVNPKGISKATGLLTVCQLIGLTMQNVMAVGDSLNDVAMIKAAGCGVAMGNAQQPVKKAADWVTGTNTEDGVAQAIQRFVLETKQG